MSSEPTRRRLYSRRRSYSAENVATDMKPLQQRLTVNAQHNAAQHNSNNSPCTSRLQPDRMRRCYPTSVSVSSNPEKELRLRTLNTTLLLITAYVVCWFPYNLSVAWYFLDVHSFKANRLLIRAFSMLIVFNSVINPLIYGINRTDLQNGCRNFCRCLRDCLMT